MRSSPNADRSAQDNMRMLLGRLPTLAETLHAATRYLDRWLGIEGFPILLVQ
jgi:hypothetical protein